MPFISAADLRCAAIMVQEGHSAWFVSSGLWSITQDGKTRIECRGNSIQYDWSVASNIRF